MTQRPGNGGRGRRPGRLTIVVAAWLVLLSISHVVRRLDADPPAPGPDTQAITLAGGVRVVYRDLRPPGPDPAPVLLLLHGSPGRMQDFDGLVPVLRERYRLLIPDLPGFGKSERDLPDYSIRAGSVAVLELLDRLGVERAHVVGFSMGGGVALELWDRAPARVASLVLLSSIGVQELELLGGYRINHAIHGLQVAALTLVHEGVPHMGLLDGSFLDVAYARNFYDTDQRPLRGVLSRFEPPMLILHGERDVLVPLAAAREHHRLVPQSELVVLPGDHFMTFRRGERIARLVDGFVERVERGEAPDRAAASPERVREAARPFDPGGVPPFTGITLLVVIGLLAAATLVSEDLACVAAGLMVAGGRLGLFSAVLACFVGIFAGDMLLYLAGRWLGRPALRRAPLRWLIRPEQLELTSRWFDKRGPVIVLLTRFLPGTRLPVYFGAGVLHTRFWTFTFYFALAVALWTPALVGLSAVLGGRMLAWLEAADRWAPLALAAVALALLLLIQVVVPAFTHRGRRLLLSRWIRITRWEYWPPWVFYPPVVAYVLWLGLKHRSPLLFTAANPAIETGGVIGESKARILSGLGGAREWVARFRLLPLAAGDKRAELAESFLREAGLDYPVVLKPDAGQRGSGVAVVRSGEELRGYLERAGTDVLIQEYVPGVELGIFWYRLPGEPHGRILSVTDKRLPEVEGDGRRTLEELILDDRRTLGMARHYLTTNAARLSGIPAAGERVRLTELGTHCRGAVFLDGAEYATPALGEAVERISRGYPGFWFGRYDARAPSPQAFREGRAFKIVELNGVTSEATHIYDPRYGVRQAWRVLREQWRIAFEIGRRNRERGHPPATLRELLAALRRYRREARLR